MNCLVVIFNFFLIWMFIRFRANLLTTTNNLLLFSMSVADFCVGVTGIVGATLFLLLVDGKTTGTVWKLCGILPFFGSFFVSVISLIIMTTDRLISVKLALRYTSIMTKDRAKLLIIATWLTVAIIICNQQMLFLFVSPWVELRTRCFLLGVLFFAGSTGLGASNAILYKTVRHQSEAIARKSTICYSRTAKLMRQMRLRIIDKRNSKICIWMTVIFIICWLPVSIYYCRLVFFPFHISNHGRTLLTVCVTLASASSLFNPCVYMINRKDFRVHLLQLSDLFCLHRSRVGIQCSSSEMSWKISNTRRSWVNYSSTY